MTLADDLRAAADGQIPEEWRERSEVIRDGVTELITGRTDVVGTDAEILKEFGYDPDQIEVLSTSQWRKQQPDGTWLTSYYFKHRPRTATIDLPALYATARRVPRKPFRATADSRVTVVALSDVQAGKVGSRGGTPELLERLEHKREALETLLKARKPQSTLLAEVGDLFEGFESGGNPMFTNDLSLAQQMDLAGTEVYKFVELMQRHGRVDVVGVPSNHTAWRRGKQSLGRPSDDLGLFVHRQVEKVANAAGIDAHWTWPAQYDESVVVDVLGTRVGIVHGNQYNAGGAVTWWANQTHGGQPVGSADILIGGHYHHLNVLPTGRNPYTGRAKWFLQCPTLDNSSDWFRNIKGDDSSPGLLVFDITEDGFDLHSLTVL